jgi:hypothetical protein
VHPIGLAVPLASVAGCVPKKRRDVAMAAKVVDGPRGRVGNSKEGGFAGYEFGPREEHAYRRSYQRSRFATTKRKSGWDCMRHHEILASGAVPWFEGLAHAPAGKTPQN